MLPYGLLMLAKFVPPPLYIQVPSVLGLTQPQLLLALGFAPIQPSPPETSDYMAHVYIYPKYDANASKIVIRQHKIFCTVVLEAPSKIYGYLRPVMNNPTGSKLYSAESKANTEQRDDHETDSQQKAAVTNAILIMNIIMPPIICLHITDKIRMMISIPSSIKKSCFLLSLSSILVFVFGHQFVYYFACYLNKIQNNYFRSLIKKKDKLQSMDANPKVTLSDGNFMPLIGLGTLNFKPNDKSFNLNDHIMNAAKTGFTHFNINPSTPQQQQALGQALRLVFEAKKQAQDQEGQKIPDQMIQAFPRQNIFVSYKVYCTANVQKDIRAALDNIKLQYFDLVMLNCTVAPPPAPVQVPQGGEPPIQDQEKKEQSGPSLLDIWKLLQGCKEKGLIKSLGVSNFSQQILLNLVPFVKHPPTVNQIESHPYAVHRNMLQTLKKMKMVMIAYSPLLRGGASQKQALGDKVDFINQPILKELSSKYAKSIPQILLNWQICRGVAVVPKTQKLDHLNDNFTITDFQLMEEDAKKLETLDKNGKIKAYQLKNTPVWRGQDPLC